MTDEPEQTEEETIDAEAIRAKADRLVARVDKLRERRMRVVYFCERIAAMDSAEAVLVLRGVIDRAGSAWSLRQRASLCGFPPEWTASAPRSI